MTQTQAQPIQIELPPLHPAQRLVRDSAARFRVMVAGRRFGKSRLASALATECALKRGVVWIITPSYSLGEPMFADIRRLASQIPGCEIVRGDRIIRYPGGGICQVKTAEEPALLRGVSLDLVVFDESAFMPRLQEVWLEVIRPALADRKGKALFCSTPNGRNFFWNLFQFGQDATQNDWQSWQFPTSTNPYIDPREIESASKQMTERQFAQEFLSQFLVDGSVFRAVRERATAEEQSRPIPGHAYVIGVDWARTHDATVFSVVDVTLQQLVYIDRMRGVDYELQVNRLKALYSRFLPASIIAESNSMGLPLIERLQRDGLPVTPFQTTNATKQTIIDGLVMAFEQEVIGILPDDVLIGELQAFEMTTLPSGMIRYGAPAGSHDDCVMALALAWSGAQNGVTGGVIPPWDLPDGDYSEATAIDPRSIHGSPGHRKWSMRHHCPTCAAEFGVEVVASL